VPKYFVSLLSLLLASAVLADELRDPTRPYSVEAVQPGNTPTFVVNAIFVSQERKIAIVNGIRVGVGDTVSGATVTDIQKSQLVLAYRGREVIAKMKQRQSQ
jgi:hypothetical protein